jgi:antitoxin HicB
MRDVSLRYPATLTKTKHNILVTFTDVPEAITFGKDKRSALLNAVDALETALSFYLDNQKSVPIPSKIKRGQKLISLKKFHPRSKYLYK